MLNLCNSTGFRQKLHICGIKQKLQHHFNAIHSKSNSDLFIHEQAFTFHMKYWEKFSQPFPSLQTTLRFQQTHHQKWNSHRLLHQIETKHLGVTKAKFPIHLQRNKKCCPQQNQDNQSVVHLHFTESTKHTKWPHGKIMDETNKNYTDKWRYTDNHWRGIVPAG